MLFALNRHKKGLKNIMKKILVLLITGILILSSLPVYAAPEYTDEAVNLLAELSIMQGDPSGDMRFSSLVSRAECAKIVVAASAYRDSVATGSKTSPFSDVPYTHWASPYITVGIKNGLCKGYLDATFRPQATVLYEEAATMLLRILGYTDEDFGSSWPDGQIGIAKNIGILDNVDKTTGDALTRRDIAAMVYNTLNAKQKGGQGTYLSTFNRSITDDVVLISTSLEDSSVSDGKIFTSAGTYNYAASLNLENIGKRGSMVLRNGDTVVSFIPQKENRGTDNQMFYSSLGNGIVTYKNGSFNHISINSDTVLYKDSVKTNAASALSSLEMGDSLRISYKSNGEIDYIMCTSGQTTGPKTVSSADWYTELGADPSVTVMRDGVKSSAADVKLNDIAYYLKDLNIALVYSKKVTGIYESASPNSDAPVSVTVSGTDYKIEDVAAFAKLSSSGIYKYGDTVTLLLGKSGEVADVLTETTASDKVYGFLTGTGTKETSVSGATVIKPYAKIVLPSGEEREYITGKNYDSLLNSVVSVTLKNGEATILKINKNGNVYGSLVWDASSKKLGGSDLSPNVKIIEVSTTSLNETAKVSSVYPQRLNGINLKDGDILFSQKNAEGEIEALILNDVTGDMHTFAILTKAKNNINGMSISGSYEYITNGTISSASTQNKAFSVSAGQIVKITESGKSILSISPLTKAASGKISSLSGDKIAIGTKSYVLSDKVQIYVKNSHSATDYTMISASELSDNFGSYTAALYMDSPGKRIRIIILS